MSAASDPHIAWLVAALTPGAKRHDSFEIERHFAVGAGTAVELGGRLHEIAGGGSALATLLEVTNASGGEVAIRYRAVDGSPRRVVAARSADGRLGPPAFH